MKSLTSLDRWLVRIILVLWAGQILWLGWFFGPEARDAVLRLASQRTGEAIRQEDAFFRWLQSLAPTIPPGATYVFLDDYQAGKEIEARYHLTPRRHILLSPKTPPDFLFYALRQEKAAFLLIREGDKPWESAEAVYHAPAFRLLPVSGPGLIFQVDHTLLLGKFYD
jgi:hypothetical protein